MKVSELIERLKEFDSNLDVIIVQDSEFGVENVRLVDEDRKSRISHGVDIRVRWVAIE